MTQNEVELTTFGNAPSDGNAQPARKGSVPLFPEGKAAAAVPVPDYPGERWAEGGWKDVTLHPAHVPMSILDAQAGKVKPASYRKKVAIVGFASSTRDLAPYDDPAFEIWGLNQLYRYMRRYDRWFEIHQRSVFMADIVRDTDYVGWLQRTPVPIYMNETHQDMPMSVRYPIETIIEAFGRDYFTSSIAFEVALAMFEGFEEIHVYGVDLIVGDEYFYQKACLEWWLGLAKGMGIATYIPKESALLKQSHRYGYHDGPKSWPFKLSQFQKRMAWLQEKHAEALTTINTLDGAMQECKLWIDFFENASKNAFLPDDVR